ncbi:MAG: flagellar basal-body rod protein FlgC [Bermanella sp.]|jgi:flagellar basal-body rod protein FlgC
MSLDSVFSIAGSGMNAQSIRLNTTASNLANADAAASSIDETYRGRHPVFAAMKDTLGMDRNGNASAGVSVLGIVESNAPLQPRYEPGHPLSDEEGYVYYPNVNVVEEMTNMISASRSFQMNVEVMNSAKQMMQRALSLGQ